METKLYSLNKKILINILYATFRNLIKGNSKIYRQAITFRKISLKETIKKEKYHGKDNISKNNSTRHRRS